MKLGNYFLVSRWNHLIFTPTKQWTTHGKYSRRLIPSLRLDVTEMSIPSSGLRSNEDFSEDYSIRPCWMQGACSKLRASGIIVLLNSLIDDWMMWTLHFDLNEVMLVMVRIEKWRENLPRRVVHFFTQVLSYSWSLRKANKEDRVFFRNILHSNISKFVYASSLDQKVRSNY